MSNNNNKIHFLIILLLSLVVFFLLVLTFESIKIVDSFSKERIPHCKNYVKLCLREEKGKKILGLYPRTNNLNRAIDRDKDYCQRKLKLAIKAKRCKP